MTEQTKPRNRLLTTENKPVVARGEGREGGMGEMGKGDGEAGTSSYKIIVSLRDERCDVGKPSIVS